MLHRSIVRFQEFSDWIANHLSTKSKLQRFVVFMLFPLIFCAGVLTMLLFAFAIVLCTTVEWIWTGKTRYAEKCWGSFWDEN